MLCTMTRTLLGNSMELSVDIAACLSGYQNTYA